MTIRSARLVHYHYVNLEAPACLLDRNAGPLSGMLERREDCMSPAYPTEATFNGIIGGIDPRDGAAHELTGAEALASAVYQAMAEYDATREQERREIEELSQKSAKKTWGFGPRVHLDDPRQAGWGVIFAAETPRSARQALDRLVRHRGERLGIQPMLLEYGGESAAKFLEKQGVKAGLGQVDRVPYYLLIAGSPEEIPYRFQYQLNSEYAVGRLHFDDPAGYEEYIRRLIEYEETSPPAGGRRAVFWAPENRLKNGLPDRATPQSAKYLVQALYDRLDARVDKRLLRGEEAGRRADKANLMACLSDDQAPALLFTASHGLAFPEPHPGQPRLQGALLTQDGRIGLPVSAAQTIAGADIGPGVNVRGLIHYAFACFGAGTPAWDDYAYATAGLAPQIAERPFVADLPQQMLANGALAFIGHVDRAWGYSFLGEWMAAEGAEAGPQLAFERGVDCLLSGLPAGHALRDQHDRALQLSNSLLENIDLRKEGIDIPELTLALQWMERNDARAYILIGDPAAHLRFAPLEEGRSTEVETRPAGEWVSGARAAYLAASTSTEQPGAPAAGPYNPISEPAGDPGAPAEMENADPLEGNLPAPDGAAESFLALIHTVTHAQPVGSGSQPTAGHEREPEPREDQQEHQTSQGVASIDPDIYAAWKAHILSGFEQNRALFDQVLDAFMRPYWLTVTLYRVLFVVGVLGFIAAAVLGLWRGVEYALVFGGLSTAAFLAFFISRPLQALERNLVVITRLGIIYNTYWTRLMYANDEAAIQKDLADSAAQALKELDRLMARQASLGTDPE